MLHYYIFQACLVLTHVIHLVILMIYTQALFILCFRSVPRSLSVCTACSPFGPSLIPTHGGRLIHEVFQQVVDSRKVNTTGMNHSAAASSHSRFLILIFYFLFFFAAAAI